MEFHLAQGDKTRYVCSLCNEPVFILPNGVIYRPCGHPDDTPVLANLEAMLFGESKLV